MKIGEKNVKKILLFLLSMMIFLSACSNKDKYKIEVGESMNNINSQYRPHITMGALSVYKTGGNYLIIIEDDGMVQKLVEFSSDRTCLYIQGLDLIKSGNLNRLMNNTFNELREKIGSPHVDIGSGFYIPAYVTEDANLVCFELEDEIITGIIQRDLLTNKIVDRINS